MVTPLNMPRTLKVLGRSVKVQPVKDLPEAVGTWNAAEYKIRIVKDQLKHDEIDTLLHEVMHATLHCQGREYGGEIEETYVRALATGLLMVLRQNPKFVGYLLQETKP